MPTRPLHILLVEDNQADARLFELLFSEREGSAVSVQCADTLAGALALLRGNRQGLTEERPAQGAPVPDSPPSFDVVLLDLTLPDSEGLATLRTLRSDERARDLPIVVLSGLANEDVALSAVREGAQDYLVKGRIDGELLGRAVRYAIERKRAQQDRKQAEQALREADEQLRQSQKMEAVGQLASGVAHDFNNLLTAIRGYASLVRNTLGENHPALESLDQVEEASRQATGVAGALLTFARRTRAEKSPVNVAQAVESAARLFRRTLPPSIRLTVDTTRADDLWVAADSTQLQQVIINLALNAKDAITARDDGKGSGTLSVEALPARAPRTRQLGARPKPTSVNIVVRDTGVGMTPDIKERIFEPFFTTKPRGRGTGLGLAVIHGIVQDHAGKVSVESTPGAGSTFTVTLPLTQAPAVQIEPRPEQPAFVPGGLALLAEDNQLVRGLLASMLAALGYEIAHASTAEQALKAAAGIDLPIDLLVVDQDLPGRGGALLLDDLRAAGHPSTRAVIVAPSNSTDEFTAPGVVLLRKPFQLADLQRAIALLDSHARTESPA
jgi:two-component system, cell cycle sensor histidine kinase and response regulator CckA